MVVQDRVAKYRCFYRKNVEPKYYSGKLHLAFTFGLATAGVVFAAVQLDNIYGLEWLTIPLTIIYANLVEYLVHRGPMHHPFKFIQIIFQRHARQHHRFFTHEQMAFESSRDFCNVLFPPYLIAFFIGGFALPVGALLNWFTTTNTALLFVITALSYFVFYELMHTAYHLPEKHPLNRLKWWQVLRRLHQNHHDPKLMTHHNFNITLPLGDWLFGTLSNGNRNKM